MAEMELCLYMRMWVESFGILRDDEVIKLGEERDKDEG